MINDHHLDDPHDHHDHPHHISVSMRTSMSGMMIDGALLIDFYMIDPRSRGMLSLSEIDAQ